LVTCDHCVQKTTVAFRPEAPEAKYAVKVLRRSTDIDLAVLALEPGAPLGGVLLPGDSTAVQPATSIDLFGFPNYGPGNTVDRHPTTVTGRVIRFNIRLFTVNTPVFPGASGGPATDRIGRVIGVIKSGYHDDEPAQGRVIDIAELASLPTVEGP
jgi:hypothetical protein